MATDLTEIHDLAVWPAFQRRVRSAMISSAVAVGSETPTSTNYSAARQGLVTSVLQDMDAWTERFAYAVAANSTITYTSTDSDITWTVASVWDALAGAGPAPPS